MKNTTKKNLSFIIIVVVLLAAISVIYLSTSFSYKKSTFENKTFPIRAGDWVGRDVAYDDVVQAVLQPDRVVSKEFKKSPDIPVIGLFMACYNTLEKAELSHSPVVCLTGQGWDIQQVEETNMTIIHPDAGEIRFNEMVQTKKGITMVALYWYQSANHAFANRGWQKLVLLFDRLRGRTDRNAFIRLTMVVPPGGTVDEVDTHLYSFIKDLYPELNGFFL